MKSHTAFLVRSIFAAAALVHHLIPHAATAEEAPFPVERKNDIPFASPDGVELLLDLYLPKGVENPPLILFIHGGGWKSGDRKNCKLAWAVGHGYALASIEYRLSQEALFPAQIHDCKGTLRWLRAHAADYGYDASKVIVAGTSAGGHLAALMGTSGDVGALDGETVDHLKQSSRVQGIIDYYGPTDFLKRSRDHPAKTEEPNGSVYKLLGGAVKENQEAARAASPITYVGKDDPPLLILHGSDDKTVHLSQSEVFAEKYHATGLEVKLQVEPGKGHGLKEPSEAEQETVLAFLKQHFGR